MQIIDISWEEFVDDINSLAFLIKMAHPGRKFDTIVALNRGGIVPAGLMVRHFPTTKLIVVDPKKDVLVLPQDSTIVIDDISDTGKTFRKVDQHLPSKYVFYIYATPYIKPLGRLAVNYYVSEYPQDYWLRFPWEIEEKQNV